jgi:hypothetical protein
MNNNVSQEFTSLKWEVKNTYFIMPVRRLCGGLEGLTPFTFMKNFHPRDYPKIPYKGEW